MAERGRLINNKVPVHFPPLKKKKEFIKHFFHIMRIFLYTATLLLTNNNSTS